MSNIAENTKLLIQAAERGDAAEVQHLIPISDPTFSDSEALCSAAQYGNAKCVELLISVSDPKADDSAALREASSNGHFKCVELLIPVSDAKANNSQALRYASSYGQLKCVELLYPVSDPTVVLKELQYDYPNDYNAWGHLQELIEVERVRNTLNAETATTAAVKVQRKM